MEGVVVEKCCENCVYYDTDRTDQPCCSCDNWVNFEEIQDIVNHPSHYESGKFECIEVMIETQGAEAVKDFCICNAFKYLYRHRRKNGVEDIAKAKWYLDKYLEIEKEHNNAEEKE